MAGSRKKKKKWLDKAPKKVKKAVRDLKILQSVAHNRKKIGYAVRCVGEAVERFL